MVGMEFRTEVHNQLAITAIFFNDGKLKNIKKEQEQYGYPEYAVTFRNPNLGDMVTSAGGLGIRVSEPEKLDEAIRAALDSPLPALVEVMVDPKKRIRAVQRVQEPWLRTN